MDEAAQAATMQSAAEVTVMTPEQMEEIAADYFTTVDSLLAKVNHLVNMLNQRVQVTEVTQAKNQLCSLSSTLANPVARQLAMSTAIGPPITDETITSAQTVEPPPVVVTEPPTGDLSSLGPLFPATLGSDVATGGEPTPAPPDETPPPMNNN